MVKAFRLKKQCVYLGGKETKQMLEFHDGGELGEPAPDVSPSPIYTPIPRYIFSMD